MHALSYTLNDYRAPRSKGLPLGKKHGFNSLQSLAKLVHSALQCEDRMVKRVITRASIICWCGRRPHWRGIIDWRAFDHRVLLLDKRTRFVIEVVWAERLCRHIDGPIPEGFAKHEDVVLLFWCRTRWFLRILVPMRPAISAQCATRYRPIPALRSSILAAISALLDKRLRILGLAALRATTAVAPVQSAPGKLIDIERKTMHVATRSIKRDNRWRSDALKKRRATRWCD